MWGMRDFPALPPPTRPTRPFPSEKTNARGSHHEPVDPHFWHGYNAPKVRTEIGYFILWFVLISLSVCWLLTGAVRLLLTSGIFAEHQAMSGYHIQASDGTIGHVSDFIMDDKSWAIRQLVVETGHWFSGKEVLISLSKIHGFSCEESKVFVNLTKETIRQEPEYHGRHGKS
jgi:hypothetical protein